MRLYTGTGDEDKLNICMTAVYQDKYTPCRFLIRVEATVNLAADV